MPADSPKAFKIQIILTIAMLMAILFVVHKCRTAPPPPSEDRTENQEAPVTHPQKPERTQARRPGRAPQPSASEKQLSETPVTHPQKPERTPARRPGRTPQPSAPEKHLSETPPPAAPEKSGGEAAATDEPDAAVSEIKPDQKKTAAQLKSLEQRVSTLENQIRKPAQPREVRRPAASSGVSEKKIAQLRQALDQIRLENRALRKRLTGLEKQQKAWGDTPSVRSGKETAAPHRSAASNENPVVLSPWRIYENEPLEIFNGQVLIHLLSVTPENARFKLILPTLDHIIWEMGGGDRKILYYKNASYFFNLLNVGERWCTISVTRQL
ncbi:hypothetical protein DENIS_4131 [Desulfonema ishimotonii]|uniref:Uncharacterized protein n=1 Tax=Desulfonema ishimotonii TaxID=45657 RepID=A0A401G1M3_9BACT|nr:hypothetical protein [Desulfonema ishimotonii]GBC63138.1 hypothetical protein DENIS_4131 [Desulfonema ishimotonii]